MYGSHHHCNGWWHLFGWRQDACLCQCHKIQPDSEKARFDKMLADAEASEAWPGRMEGLTPEEQASRKIVIKQILDIASEIESPSGNRAATESP